MAEVISVRVGLRLRGGIRFWPVICGVSAFVLGMAYVEADYFRPTYRYVLADAVAASTAIVVVGAIVSLVAAVQMSVIVDVWGRLDVRRPVAVVYLRQLWPAIAVGMVSMAAIYAVFVGRDLVRIFSLWSIVAVSVASIVAWAGFGAALGLWLSRIAAYPIALLLPLFLMAFPVSWEPLWARHLTGALFDCCDPSRVLHPAAVGGSVLAAGAVLAASLAGSAYRLGRRSRPSVAVVGGAVVSVGLATAAVLAVRDLGVLPTTQRLADDVECVDDVCVWPEAAPTIGANSEALARVEVAWLGLGLPLPDSVRIHPQGADGGLRLAVASEDVDQVVASMVSRFPAELARCRRPPVTGGSSTSGYDPAADRLSWLLGRELGIPDEELSFYLLEPDDRVAQAEAVELWQHLAGCSS